MSDLVMRVALVWLILIGAVAVVAVASLGVAVAASGQGVGSVALGVFCVLIAPPGLATLAAAAHYVWTEQ